MANSKTTRSCQHVSRRRGSRILSLIPAAQHKILASRRSWRACRQDSRAQWGWNRSAKPFPLLQQSASAVTTPREHLLPEARRKATVQRLSMLKRAPRNVFFSWLLATNTGIKGIYATQLTHNGISEKRYCTSNQILEEASLEIKWSKIVAFHVP
jgi:hypothetical protein